MALWHVFYESWQMECCGTEFSVGQEVGWPLLFTEAEELLGGDWRDELSEVAGLVEDLPGEEGDLVRVLREESGPTVALGGAAGAGVVPGDRVRLSGMLAVEAHGGQWPKTRGRVRAIQVVTQEYEDPAPEELSWTPARGPGARRLRSVQTCPRWFTNGTHEGGGGGRLMEAGVMVTMDVPAGG